MLTKLYIINFIKKYKIFFIVMSGILTGLFIKNFKYYKIDPNFFKSISFLWINLIKMFALPMIFTSVMHSLLTMLRSSSKSGKVVLDLLFLFFITSLTAVLLSFFLSDLLINKIFKLSPSADLISNIGLNPELIDKHKQFHLMDIFFNMIPSNMFTAFAESNFIQIIFCAIIISIAIYESEKISDLFLEKLNFFSLIFKNSINIILKFTNVSIFSIITWIVATQKSYIIQSLSKLILADLLIGFVLIYIIYAISIRFFLKLNPFIFFKKIIPIQLFCIATSSSAASMPIAIENSVNKLGIESKASNFLLPFSLSINMNGGVIHFASSIVFIAAIYGYKLTAYQYIIGILISMITPLGVGPIPGGTFLLLGSVLTSVGLPHEGIVLIFAIDRILDIIRTCINMTTDLFITLAVAKKHNLINLEIYKKN